MNFKVFTLLFLVIVTGLLSCKNVKDIAPVTPILTNLSVINATADTINYYLNGTRQNNTSDLYPAGSTGYLQVYSGLQNYQFKKANSSVALFSVPYTLDTNKYYSVFVAGTTAAQTFITVDSLGSADLLLDSDKTDTKSVIRFVNASPDAGPLTVTVGINDSLNLVNKSFMSVSPFKTFTVTPSTPQHIKVFLANSTIAKLDTTVTFQTSAVYTLFSRGLLAGKGASAFDVSLILN